MGAGRGQVLDERSAPPAPIEVVELELLKLVRHLDTFGRRSSLYGQIDRAGYLALRTIDTVGPVCIHRLAQSLHLDASTVTRQVAALESGGFVMRHVDPSDRRSWLIELTSQGRKAMHAVERGRRRAIAAILVDWKPDEVDDLARSMTKLNLAVFANLSDHAPAVS